MRGHLYGVGVGPGDPELMTLKAVRIIEESDIICALGDYKGNNLAYDIASRACPDITKKPNRFFLVPMTKDRNTLERVYREAADSIEELLDDGKKLAFLTLGDPSIYSAYIYIHRQVLSDGYEARIISGVTSFCAAAAIINDSLIDRSEQLHILPASYSFDNLGDYEGTKILMKAGKSYEKVRAYLIENNVNAYMVENCGSKEERVYKNIFDFPEECGYYSIIVVKDKEQENNGIY